MKIKPEDRKFMVGLTKKAEDYAPFPFATMLKYPEYINFGAKTSKNVIYGWITTKYSRS